MLAADIKSVECALRVLATAAAVRFQRLAGAWPTYTSKL